MYGGDNTGCIYRRDADGHWIRVYKDPDGAIKGMDEWYTDDGKVWLYFATDSLEKRKELPGLDNWNDVQTVGNLTSTDWHTHKQAGGALTIANKGLLAFVGYDGSFTPEALDVIPGNIVKTIVERSGRAILGTYRAADTTRAVNGAIDSEIPLAQVGNDGDIFFSNMSDSIPVTRFPGGGKVNPGGVTNKIDQVNFFEWEEGAASWIDKHAVGNLAMFGVFDASSGYNGVYTYGRKRKNHPFVMNMEYELEVDEIGAVIDIEGTTLISYRSLLGGFGVKATDANTKATGVYEGLDFKSPLKRPQNITNWKLAEVLFDPLPNGTAIEFWYRLDKYGSFIQARTDTGDLHFALATKKKAVFFINADAQIFEPRVVLVPWGNSTPEIHRIRIFFN